MLVYNLIDKMRVRVRIEGRERPLSSSLEHDLDWLCSTFGFCSKTQQKTGNSVFKEIIKRSRQEEPPTSTELANELGLSRGAVINQLNRLMQAGLIEKDGCRYMLRGANLERTMREVERDIERVFSEVREMAAELDARLGFGSRTRNL